MRNGALGHSSLESIGDNKTQPHLRCAVESLNRPENSKTPDRFLDRFFSPLQHPPIAPRRRACVGVLQCRAIVPNGSARRASVGVLRLFGFFVSLVAVASRFRSIGDNRSTMPTHSGGVIQCRATVPNGSARRASVGFLRLFGCFVLLAAVASWFRSIADNRSTMPPRKRRHHTV